MKRIVILIGLIAALGAVSVPAAKADGINLCIGCMTTPPSMSSGSTSICLDSAVCPHWNTYRGYALWGPLGWYTTRSGSNDFMGYIYRAYDATGRTYYGRIDCFYLGNVIFSGCFWV
jgi:hypothetical protein